MGTEGKVHRKGLPFTRGLLEVHLILFSKEE